MLVQMGDLTAYDAAKQMFQREFQVADGPVLHAMSSGVAGLVAATGAIAETGKLCSANSTPALRAKYDALQATSTPVERLHAVGRVSDDRHKRQRNESRAGDSLGRYNNQAGWLTGEIDERGGLKVAETMLAACRKAAGRVDCGARARSPGRTASGQVRARSRGPSVASARRGDHSGPRPGGRRTATASAAAGDLGGRFGM